MHEAILIYRDRCGDVKQNVLAGSAINNKTPTTTFEQKGSVFFISFPRIVFTSAYHIGIEQTIAECER
jgi:hypothetical protein